MPRNPNSPYNSHCDFPAIMVTASENIKLQAMITKLEKSLSKSTYQIWLDNGHEGTEEDFLNWLVGPPTTIVIDGKTYAYITETKSVDLSEAFVPYNSALSHEVDRSTAEDIRLANLIANAAKSLREECDLLYASIDAEASSRISADNKLTTKLNTETSRAIQREDDLENLINRAISDLTATINNQIAAETFARLSAINQVNTDLQTTEQNLLKKINTESNIRRDYDDQLANQLADERTAREESVARIETDLANEISTARSAESELERNLSQETADRITTDTALDNRLTVEIAERTAAINLETTNRTEADYILTSHLNQEIARSTEEDTRLTETIEARTTEFRAEDLAIRSDLNAEINERLVADQTLKTELNLEISRATQKENELEQSITNVNTTLSATIETRCTTETTERLADVARLTTDIETLYTKADTLTTQLSIEQFDRETADTLLTENLETERSERQQLETTLREELAAESAEARTAEEKLNQKLAKELVDRSTADLALNARLAGEESTRQTADAANAQAILDESVARRSADETILNTIGGNFDTVNTVASAVSTEQQERINADSGLNDRLVEVETTLDVFFKDADKDGEGLEKALDTLKEIQTFINTDTTTAAKMVEDINKNAADIVAQAAFDAQTYETKTDAVNKLTETKTYTDGALETAKAYSDANDVFHTDILTVNPLGGVKAGVDLDGMTIREVLTTLLYPYVQFVLGNTSRSAAAATLENGATQTLSSASITVTKKSKAITSIKLLNGDTILEEKTGDTVANGGTFTFNGFDAITVSKSNNPNLKFTVTDGEETDSKNIGASTFVYPYYWGKCAKDATIDETLVESLTKKIESKGNKTDISFTCADERMVFAYPKAHGTLKSIIDPNNFEIINDFTRHEVSITGLDETAQTYYVYVSGASTVTAFKVDFKY